MLNAKKVSLYFETFIPSSYPTLRLFFLRSILCSLKESLKPFKNKLNSVCSLTKTICLTPSK